MSGMQGKRRISYTAERIQWVIWNLSAVTHHHVLFQFLCFSLLILPSLLHLSFLLPLYFLCLFLPFSPALFLSSPPFPSFPWISFFSLFLSSPFLPAIFLSLTCISLPLSSPFAPPDFYFPFISSSPSLLPFLCHLRSQFLDKKNLPARLSARRANSTDANPTATLNGEIPCMDTVMQLHRWPKSLGNRDLKIRHCPASLARIPQRAGANAG